MKKITFLFALVLIISTLSAQTNISRTARMVETSKVKPEKVLLGKDVNAPRQKAIALPVTRQGVKLSNQVMHAPAAASAATVFSENFDATPLTGWTLSTSTTPNWQQGNPQGNPFSTIDATNVSSLTHAYSEELTLDNIMYTTVNLTSFPANSTLGVSFWAGYSGPWMIGGSQAEGAGADVKAVVSTNGGTTWTPIWAYTDSHNGTEGWLWENYYVSLNAYAGQTILLGFQYVGLGGDLAAIDNVSVLEGCENLFTTPLSLAAAGNTVTATWAINNAPDSYIIEVNGEPLATQPAATAASHQFTVPNDGIFEVTITADYSGCPSVSSDAEIVIGTPCQYSIEMTDSYGDGWEGIVAVFQNGINTAVLYIEDGDEETLSFDVYNAPIEIWWLDGYRSNGMDYDEEDFTIYNSSGNEIFTTGTSSIDVTADPPVIYTGMGCITINNDAAITAITAPAVNGVNLTTTEAVTATIKNNGTNAITSVNLELTVDGGAPVIETYTGNIAAGATYDYTFTATADLSAAGEHTVAVKAILIGDQDATNDSKTVTVNNTVCSTVTLPFTEDFENNGIDCWTRYTSLATGGWALTTTDGYVRGTQAARHSYNFSEEVTGWLVTPQINIPATGTYVLEFYSINQFANDHVYGGVWISTAGNDPADGTFTEVKVLSGDEVSAVYKKITVPLNGYAGQSIYISFKYQGENADAWYIDDVSVNETAAVDAQVTAITQPVAGTNVNLTAAEQVKAMVKNNGSDPLTGFSLRLELDGEEIATETFSGTIAPMAEAEYTFNATLNLAAEAEYEIEVTAVAAGDAEAENDSLIVTVNNTVCSEVTLPFTEDFENGIACWTIESTHSSPLSNWHTVEYPADAEDCPDCGVIATIEYSNASMMDERLISPAFNLPALSTNQRIDFSFDVSLSYYWHVSPYNGADFSVEASTDGGTNWTEIWNETTAIPDTASFEWFNRVIDVSNYAGQDNVKFAFRYLGNDGAAIYLNNVKVSVESGASTPAVNANKINITQNNEEVSVNVSENSAIRVIDMYGRVLGSYNAAANSTVNIYQPSGIYLFEVRSNSGVSTHKFLVR